MSTPSRNLASTLDACLTPEPMPTESANDGVVEEIAVALQSAAKVEQQHRQATAMIDTEQKIEHMMQELEGYLDRLREIAGS